MASDSADSAPELIDPFGGSDEEDPDLFPDPSADDPPFGDEPLDDDDDIPTRARLLRSVFVWSPIEDVALAVSVASATEPEVYVERHGDQYRWSLIHRGGPYPLLRITARFLRVDYQSIFIGFRGVSDGYSALSNDSEGQNTPDAWIFLRLSDLAFGGSVERLIVRRLG